jgi:hypothetical protein
MSDETRTADAAVAEAEPGGDVLLEATDVSKVFGGLVAVNDITFRVPPKSIVALIGPNGAGKTTFFNLLTGLYRPTTGRVVFDGKDITAKRPDLVTKIRSNPLFRALRVDKLTYAALEATLMAYAKQDYDSIPALRMMRLPVEEIEKRAQAIFERSCAENERRIKDGALPQAHSLSSDTSQSVIGGGAAPGATLPTVVLALKLESITADEVLHRLRQLDPPIIARVEDDRVLLDLRTVFPEQDEAIVRALLAVTA